MKFSKKDWIFLAVGLVVLFLIWWFFFRNKSSESGYGTGVTGSMCWSNNQCARGLGCRGGQCQPKKRRATAPASQPAVYVGTTPTIRETPLFINPTPQPAPQPATQPTSGVTGASLYSNYPMAESVTA